MTVYSVYEPAGEADPERRADKIAFVKEGFNWLALIVPVIWLLYRRMWLEALAFLALFLTLPALFGSDPAGKEIGGFVSLGMVVVFAFMANDLRAWSLRRRGFGFAGTASGRDRVEAELRFFSRWLADQDRETEAPSASTPPAKSLASAPIAPAAKTHPITPTRPLGGDDVIGSFPRS